MEKNIYISACDKDEGIYHYKLSVDGSVKFCKKYVLDCPMYAVVSNQKLYVILRCPFDNDESGILHFDIAPDGSLENPSEPVSTGGVVACHLFADNDDVYIVNYLSGNVMKLPDTIDTHTGSGPDKVRQDMPHTHFVGETPDKKYICVTDLGLDRIFFYDRGLNQKFSVEVEKSFGARHLAFSADGKYMYCVNEMKSSVSVFEYKEKDTRLIKTYPAIPSDFKEKNLAAAIRIKDDRLYVSNRGYDSIAVFKINGAELEFEGHIKTGREPRDFNIAGDILICADMADGDVIFFRLDGAKAEKLPGKIDNLKDPLCVTIY